MIRLIDAEALKEDLRRFFPFEVLEGIEPKTLFAQIMHDIDNAPTVNPESCRECPFVADEEKQITNSDARASEERTKGEWIYYKKMNNWICSECGETPKTIGYVGNRQFMTEHFKYCNHCGADMRKGSTESLDYQRAVEDTEYCERYEPTYNPNDGSM